MTRKAVASNESISELGLLINKARDQRVKLGHQFCFLKTPPTLNEVERVIFRNVQYLVNITGPFKTRDIQYIDRVKLTPTDVSKLKAALNEYNRRRK